MITAKFRIQGMMQNNSLLNSMGCLSLDRIQLEWVSPFTSIPLLGLHSPLCVNSILLQSLEIKTGVINFWFHPNKTVVDSTFFKLEQIQENQCIKTVTKYHQK